MGVRLWTDRRPVASNENRCSPVSATATLKIWRGDVREAGRWQSFEVPFEPGQSVLDGLR